LFLLALPWLAPAGSGGAAAIPENIQFDLKGENFVL
jgi:hypothetical protein